MQSTLSPCHLPARTRLWSPSSSIPAVVSSTPPLQPALPLAPSFLSPTEMSQLVDPQASLPPLSQCLRHLARKFPALKLLDLNVLVLRPAPVHPTPDPEPTATSQSTATPALPALAQLVRQRLLPPPAEPALPVLQSSLVLQPSLVCSSVVWQLYAVFSVLSWACEDSAEERRLRENCYW